MAQFARRGYLPPLLDLVVDFFEPPDLPLAPPELPPDDFFAVVPFFIAMALVPPFCWGECKESKKSSQRFFPVATAVFT